MESREPFYKNGLVDLFDIWENFNEDLISFTWTKLEEGLCILFGKGGKYVKGKGVVWRWGIIFIDDWVSAQMILAYWLIFIGIVEPFILLLKGIMFWGGGWKVLCGWLTKTTEGCSFNYAIWGVFCCNSFCSWLFIP